MSIDLQNKINELYKTFGYLNKKDFINFTVNELDDKYQKNDIVKTTNEIVNSKPDYQITTAQRNRVKYEIEKLPGSFQMDLVFFNNTELPYLLIIDVVSRKCWIYRVKSKQEADIYPAFENWFYQGLAHKDENARFVGSILSDEESGFTYGQKFLDLFNRNHIRFILKEPNEHNIMKILDRCVRTLKTMFYRKINTLTEEEFKDVNNPEALTQIIYAVVDDYNSKPHSSLDNKTPNEVYNDFDLQDKLYRESHQRNMQKRKNDIKFKPNEFVRVKDRRNNKLEKTKYYSDKVYQIYKRTPYSYSVRNIDGTIPREFNPRKIGLTKFKPHEIKRVPVNSITTDGRYRLEKIKSISNRKNSSEEPAVELDVEPVPEPRGQSRYGRVYKPNPKYL